jgi:lysophospholipase L1-like esterase
MDILFIGDSLIEYFDWGRRFPGHRAANLGVSGETAELLLERLPRIASAHPAAGKVFLMTGINNVAMEEGASFLKAYREVLAHLGDAYPDARIYANSLLPTMLPWVRPRTIEEVNASLKSLAEEAGAVYLDVHRVFMEGNLIRLLSPDGVHLSEKGYEVWAGVLEKIIGPARA